MKYTLTILDEHRQALKKTLLRDDFEYGALLICGRSQHRDIWSGATEESFVVREIVEVPEEMFTERSRTGMTWSTTPFFNALKKVESKGFAVAVIHSHPSGPLEFSRADDIADQELFPIAFNRLESERPHLSMIMDGDGNLSARAYGPNLKPQPVELIKIIGERWTLSYPGRADGLAPIEFERQSRVFGKLSTADIAKLRIGVVGCGGTGSAVVSMLARIGAQRLALFDSDCVEDTNLNRLHFATRTDANLRRLKVDVVGGAVADLGLPINVFRFPYNVDDPHCRDAIRSCDIIFGCTDDHLGRNFLNRFSHFYLVPVIDLGLLIEPKADFSGYDSFDGRVTVVQPGSPCQICRGLVSPERMSAESMRRSHPELHDLYRRAGYIPDSPDPSPVVVTFTTELASMAVNELFQRLNGFRGPNGHCAERVRRFDEVKDADSVPAGKSKKGCKLCDLRKYDGRGDMTPFLDMV